MKGITDFSFMVLIRLNRLEGIKNRFAKAFLGAALPLFFLACGSEKDCSLPEKVSQIPVNVDILRLENEINQIENDAQAIAFLDKYRHFSETYLQRSQLPHDSILVNDLMKLAKDPYIDTMRTDVQQLYGDMTAQKTELENFFRYVKFHYPDFHVPQVMTCITGFSGDLFVSDSVVVIGLEFFTYPGFRYQPPQVPNYILRRLRPQTLVPSIATLITDKFNKIEMLDNTMLQEMIKWGKVYYFLQQTIPCINDSIIAGYSGAEMEEIADHHKEIWSHFVERKLFFETDHFLIKKYCDERPNVLEIGDKCPGRIGRWLGWQIVKRYAERENLPLPVLMAETNAKKIFNMAKYKP